VRFFVIFQIFDLSLPFVTCILSKREGTIIYYFTSSSQP